MGDVVVGGLLALGGTVLGVILSYWGQAAGQRRTDARRVAEEIAGLDDYVYAHSKLSRLNAHFARIGLKLRTLGRRADQPKVERLFGRFRDLARKAWYASLDNASKGGHSKRRQYQTTYASHSTKRR